MRCLIWIAAVSFFLAVAGCGSHNSSASPTAAASSGAADQTATSAAAPGTSPQAVSPNDADALSPPEGAQYTLLCNSFTGVTHIVDAKRAKDYLIERTGSKSWYVIHQEDQSNLYYGFYKTFEDRTQPDEYNRAQADRASVAALLDQNGDRLFRQVMFVPIDLPSPQAPKEWELAQNSGYWTLQIAIYRGSPLIKQYAVDAVRQARAMGVEAYYHHSVGTSEVYVGSWPREAVKEQDSDSAVAESGDAPLLVLSGPIEGAENSDFYTKDGRKMKVVMPKVEIQDISLKQMIEKYPNTWINGELRGRKKQLPDGSFEVKPYPCVLVVVPHGDSDQAQGESKPSDTSTHDAPSADPNDVPIVPNR